MEYNHGEPATQLLRQRRPLMQTTVGRMITSVACAALLAGTAPAPLFAQAPPPPPQQQGGQQQGYSPEQLDAVLAPIALYPDQLLTQVLMASAFPDQVTAAAQWIGNPANGQLQGDALANALVPLPWDPSVKSLVPFPQVLQMMTAQQDWLQQLGYAMSVQQPDVMASVQRLRQQAQIAGQLHSSDHQVVSSEGSTIVIAPAQPNVVYVPSYNPVDVYGAWPYPSYPPFYLPPPVGYYGDAALVGGLAFGAGIAIGAFATAGLWGWARPNWGGGGVYINVNNYNRWSPGRPWNGGANWHPYRPVGRPGWGYRAPGAAFHPPGGYRPAGYRPGAPGYRPGAPGYRPGAPGYRPPPPAVRPGGARPGAPIAHPGAHPGERPGTRPGERPGTRPATRPPGERSGARPPAARPAPRPEAGRPGGAPRPESRPAPRPAARPAPAPHPAPRPAPRPAGGGEHKH